MRCQVHDLVDLLLRDGGLAATPGPDLPSFAKPSLVNRSRHARTVAGFTPTCTAILLFATPSAASNSAFAR
jgi:hypothetical protein